MSTINIELKFHVRDFIIYNYIIYNCNTNKEWSKIKFAFKHEQTFLVKDELLGKTFLVKDELHGKHFSLKMNY